MMQALAELAIDRDADGKKLPARERSRLLAQARAVEHRPAEKLDLTYEHELSLLAIENIHKALRRAYEIAFEVAASSYPRRLAEALAAPAHHRLLGRLRSRRPFRHPLVRAS